MDDSSPKTVNWSASQRKFNVVSNNDEKEGSSRNSPPEVQLRDSTQKTETGRISSGLHSSVSTQEFRNKPNSNIYGRKLKNPFDRTKHIKTAADLKRDSGPSFVNRKLTEKVRGDFLGNSHPDYGEKIKQFFAEPSPYDTNTKADLLLGKTERIASAAMGAEDQAAYFNHAIRLYLRDDNAPYSAIVKRKIHELEQLPADEKIAFRNDLLKHLTWKMTPNQRQILRRHHRGIYGAATLGDDINCLYFDTVVRLYTKGDESFQKRLLKDVIAAPEETRLEKRQKIMDIAHSHLTADQRTELKRICKARYDQVINSRSTALQVAIRENKWERVIEYTIGVLRYAPANQRLKLLEARADTDMGANQGESAFSNILVNAPLFYVQAFMQHILYTTQLTLLEKFLILRAERRSDHMPAFQLLAGLGYTERVRLFMETIEFWERPTEFDRKSTETFTFFNPIKKHKFSKGGPYTAKVRLIYAGMSDDTRVSGEVGAYTRALENGHEKCRKMMKHYTKRHMRILDDARFVLKMHEPVKSAKDNEMTEQNLAQGRRVLAEMAAWPPEKKLLYDYQCEIEWKANKEAYYKDPVPSREANKQHEIQWKLEKYEQDHLEFEIGKQYRASLRRPFHKVKSFFTTLVTPGAVKSGINSGTMTYSKLEDASEGG
jgi:hypothetical protein